MHAGEVAECLCFWEAGVIESPSSPDSSSSASSGSSAFPISSEDATWDLSDVQPFMDHGSLQEGDAVHQTVGGSCDRMLNKAASYAASVIWLNCVRLLSRCSDAEC